MHDQNDVVGSALVGLVATILQECAASGAIDPDRLRKRLEAFGNHESVLSEPEQDQKLIRRIIETLNDGIGYGELERGNAKH